MTKRSLAVLVLVLATMFAIEVTTSLQESQTYDEAVHLSSGLSYWRTGDFRLNPEHPPLIKLLAAAPLLFTKATLPLSDASWSNVDEWRFGELFLYENRLSPQTLLFLGRLPIMLLSVLLGWLIFKASRAMFGPTASWLALCLYAFDPSIIAHSRYVTTDLGFTAFAFLALLRLDALLRTPNKKNAWWFGLALFAAGLSKFSGAAFLVTLVAVLVVMKVHSPQNKALAFRKVGKFLLVAVPVAWLLIWSMYGFDIRSPGTDPRVARLENERTAVIASTPTSSMSSLHRVAVNVLGDPSHGIGSWLEHFKQGSYPTYTFFRGLTAVVSHATGGHGSFLLGMSSDTGWWYYFPVAFIAKTPIPTLVAMIGSLLILGLTLRMNRRQNRSWLVAFRALDQRWILFIIMPVTFIGIAMVGHLNLGWRHIMPIYPPLLVLASGVGSIALSGPKRWRYLVPALLISNIIFVEAATYPNQMGFFSPLVGGSHNGPNVLQDSNLDWGQDLPKLERYVQDHRLTSLPFSYYGRARVATFVPQATDLPSYDQVQADGQPKAIVAISVGQLYDKGGNFRWLWTKQPTEKIGSSILVYDLR